MGVAVPVEVDALVRAAQADPAAFALLYRRYVRQVYGYVYNRVRDHDDTEDITAQVFADVMAALPRYRERGEFAAWLFRITRRRCADHFRGHRAEEPLLPSDAVIDPFPDVDAAVDLAALSRRVLGMIARLDEDKQELCRLRFAAGLTYSEIGAVLGRQPAAVKMAIHRILDRLAETVEVSHDAAH